MLGVRRAQEIRASITRRMDLWERGMQAALEGDADVEGTTREGRAASNGKDEYNAMAHSY